jgi:hypothetical protein
MDILSDSFLRNRSGILATRGSGDALNRSICCNILVGYGAQNVKAEGILPLILPFVVSDAFFLIADIDSPRGGINRVHPHNLASLVESLRAH